MPQIIHRVSVLRRMLLRVYDNGGPFIRTTWHPRPSDHGIANSQCRINSTLDLAWVSSSACFKYSGAHTLSECWLSEPFAMPVMFPVPR